MTLGNQIRSVLKGPSQSKLTELQNLGFLSLNPLASELTLDLMEWGSFLRQIAAEDMNLALTVLAQNTLSFLRSSSWAQGLSNVQLGLGFTSLPGSQLFIGCGEFHGLVFDFQQHQILSATPDRLKGKTTQLTEAICSSQVSAQDLLSTPLLLPDAYQLFQTGVSHLLLELLKQSYLDVLNYSFQRQQGGRAIFGWSEHRRLLGELKLQLDLAELAAKNIGSESSIEVLNLSLMETVLPFISEAMQLMGGMGYMKDCRIEGYFRLAHIISAMSEPLALRKIRYVENGIEND
jgi:hypothetical protein